MIKLILCIVLFFIGSAVICQPKLNMGVVYENIPNSTGILYDFLGCNNQGTLDNKSLNPPPVNQGFYYPSCWSIAISYGLISDAAFRSQKIQLDRKIFFMSPTFGVLLNSQNYNANCSKPQNVPVWLDSLLSFGVPLMDTNENIGNPCSVSAKKYESLKISANKNKVSYKFNHFVPRYIHPRNLCKVKEILDSKIPLLININVGGDIPRTMALKCKKDYDLVGFHAMLLVGYDSSGFIALNSYGDTNVGAKEYNGYVHIDYAYARSHSQYYVYLFNTQRPNQRHNPIDAKETKNTKSGGISRDTSTIPKNALPMYDTLSFDSPKLFMIDTSLSGYLKLGKRKKFFVRFDGYRLLLNYFTREDSADPKYAHIYIYNGDGQIKKNEFYIEVKDSVMFSIDSQYYTFRFDRISYRYNWYSIYHRLNPKAVEFTVRRYRYSTN